MSEKKKTTKLSKKVIKQIEDFNSYLAVDMAAQKSSFGAELELENSLHQLEQNREQLLAEYKNLLDKTIEHTKVKAAEDLIERYVQEQFNGNLNVNIFLESSVRQFLDKKSEYGDFIKLFDDFCLVKTNGLPAYIIDTIKEFLLRISESELDCEWQSCGAFSYHEIKSTSFLMLLADTNCQFEQLYVSKFNGNSAKIPLIRGRIFDKTSLSTSLFEGKDVYISSLEWIKFSAYDSTTGVDQNKLIAVSESREILDGLSVVRSSETALPNFIYKNTTFEFSPSLRLPVKSSGTDFDIVLGLALITLHAKSYALSRTPSQVDLNMEVSNINGLALQLGLECPNEKEKVFVILKYNHEVLKSTFKSVCVTIGGKNKYISSLVELGKLICPDLKKERLVQNSLDFIRFYDQIL